MATKRKAPKDDEIKAQKRFVDQPGQWQNVTPESVKRRQAKAWKEREKTMSAGQKKKTGTTSRKKK